VSKSIGAGLLTHYLERCTTIAHALRVTRSDGVVKAYTTYRVDQTINGVTYLSSPGLDVSQLEQTSGFAVATINLTTLDDGEVFTFFDLMSRVWENSSYTIFRYNYLDSNIASLGSVPIDTMSTGTIGVITRARNMVSAELRDLRQKLQHNIGESSSKLCRNRLGDARCGVVLTGSPNQFTAFGSVSAVDSNQVFYAANRNEAVGWYDDGELTWTTGPNAGLTMAIKAYEDAGSPSSSTKKFTLKFQCIGTVAVGNAFSLVAGCRKRLEEDCVAKFNNGRRHGGEPHRPLMDDLTKPIDVSV
jgi:uncharacterized phage protein (TIGR02218 family)